MSMKAESLGAEMPTSRATPTESEASAGVVLTVLSNLKNGKIEEALVGFAEEFRFKDYGIGLEFTDKKRLAEFFEKTRDSYPDVRLQTDAIFTKGDHVITEWTL